MKKSRHQGRGKNGQTRQDQRKSHGNAQKPHKSQKTQRTQKSQNVQKAGRSARNVNQKQCDLFGIHAVTEALLNSKRHVHEIVATAQGEKILAPIVARAEQAGLKRPPIQVLDKYAFEAMLPEGAVHQGVGLAVQALHGLSLDEFCAGLNQNGRIQDNIFVVLDQVTDPHNIGAILRSAAVFDGCALIVQDRHTPEMGGTLAKVACGAVEHVPILREVNLSRSLETLKKYDILCVGLDERGKMTLSDVTADKNLSSYSGIALVMGAEGDGLRRLTAENCDVLAKLPATGQIKSLNVSNAAAVSLYEIVR